MWRALTGPDGPSLASPVGVELPEAFTDEVCEGFLHQRHLVVEGPTGLLVFDLAAGVRVAHVPNGVGAFPLPRDLGLIYFLDDVPWSCALAAPYAARPLQLTADEELDNPAAGTALALEGDRLRLLFACYGRLVLLEGRPGEGGTLTLETTADWAALVMDPVYVSRGPGARHLLNHGYGSALSMIDLETREQVRCPLPPGHEAPDYGLFGGGLVAPAGERALVQTRDGPFLWRFSGELRALPEELSHAVLLEDDACYVRVGGDLHRRALEETEEPS